MRDCQRRHAFDGGRSGMVVARLARGIGTVLMATVMALLTLSWLAIPCAAAVIEAGVESAVNDGGVVVVVVLNRSTFAHVHGTQDGYTSPEARALIMALSEEIIESLPAHGWETRYRYKTIPAFTGFAHSAALERLSVHPAVERVGLDMRGHGAAAEAPS